MIAGGPRRIDHVVMPVETLDAAESLLSALGFTVAPRAVHPFGTANACVFFEDGTYIEPLAVADAALCGREAGSGNVFVASDRAYRAGAALPGFSAVALGSGNADADRDGFERAGVSAGQNLEFRRIARTPTGEETELGFRLAFAADRRSPDLSLFTCQPIHTTKPDRSALTGHANGVRGLSRIVLVADEPGAHLDVLQAIVGVAAQAGEDGGFLAKMPNAIVELVDPALLSRRYGVEGGEGRGLRIAGLALLVDGLDELRRRLATPLETADERLVVAPSAERPAFFAFEPASGGARNTAGA